jgi:hypothetical protein
LALFILLYAFSFILVSQFAFPLSSSDVTWDMSPLIQRLNRIRSHGADRILKPDGVPHWISEIGKRRTEMPTADSDSPERFRIASIGKSSFNENELNKWRIDRQRPRNWLIVLTDELYSQE